MTPRKRIVATGYALNADKLDDLDTSAVGGSNAFVPVTDSSGNFTLTKNLTVDSPTFFVDSTNHRVGVGLTSPAALFSVGAASQHQVNTLGDVFSTFTTLDGSSTANGAGANSTTLILNSATNFDVGN